MKSIIRFWQQDIINKLIILVVVGLIAGAGVVAYVLMTMLPGAHSQQSEALPTVVPMQATDTRAPTPTTAFVVTVAEQLSPTGSPTPVGTPTGGPTAGAPNAGATSAPVPLSSACIPDHSAETGKVLSVVDGNTIRVYTGGLVYFVRYIGVDVPRDGEVKQLYGPSATYENSSLVYGKSVTLIRDVSDKDAAGRLLRYVMVGSTFVNLELLRSGMATAPDSSPNISCSKEFRQAEQAARQQQVGRWSGTPTPLPTVP